MLPSSLHRQLLQWFPLDEIVDELSGISGMAAVTLGGSWAAGRQRPDSDVDLGLYYRMAHPLDVDGVRRIAERLNDTPDPVVTPLGGWGTWVNGGAWLTINGRRLDFLYRDFDFVAEIIDECLAGRSQPDYWQQPPYGFHSQIYCAEINVCRPLYDPASCIAPLKDKVSVYPEALKRRQISSFLWGAGFTLAGVKQAPERGEAYLVAGHLTRAATELIQVLYALNETYFMNDKYIYRDVGEFSIVPTDFMGRIDEIAGGEPSRAGLRRRVDAALSLRAEVVALAGNLYTARY